MTGRTPNRDVSLLQLDSVAAEARIRPHIIGTPLHRSAWLSQLAGAHVYLKLENRQETGAFKLRGAANKLLQLAPAQARRGVVTASNGNHALAVASIGRKLRIGVDVFVSEHIDKARLAKIQALGATTRRVLGDCLAAEQAARREAEESGRTYVSPYNDAEVIEGQGTIAVELLRQLPQVDAVFVAVGGGGLVSGIGAHLNSVSPATEVVGCWPAHSPALYECLRAGRIIDVDEKPTLSVSTAGGIEADAITFGLAQRVIDTSVLVGEDEILESLRRVYDEDEQLLEGAAGVAIAGFRQRAPRYAGKTVAIIACGGNADPDLAERIRTAEHGRIDDLDREFF